MKIDWQELVRSHATVVWATVNRYVTHRADAEDCFQETFVKAMEVSRKQPVRHWAGLLQRIATTTALDLLRKRIRERRRFGENGVGAMDGLPDEETSPWQRMAVVELAERLRASLTKLPEQQAQVFCLRTIDGLSYEEIGAALNMTAGNVGVVMHRARMKLEELMPPEDTINRGFESQRSGESS